MNLIRGESKSEGGKLMELKLPNGFSVDFYAEKDGVYIALVNPNNYVVTDRKLTTEEETSLKDKLK